jgi:hypothetical protein
MVRMLNALGDRLLAKVLPTADADAAGHCRGTCINGKCGPWCFDYCYRYSSGNRSTRYQWCDQPGKRTCRVLCSDCC